MKSTFKNALAACAAIATFVGGAHVVWTYLDANLTSRVKSVIAADAAAQPMIEMIPEPALPAKKK
jgi:hypothetical protein